MTDNEIIKALTIHTIEKYDCGGCPYIAYKDCSDKIVTDSLELITRQQAEIERLKRENKILSKNADNAFQDGLNEAQDLYSEQVKNEVRAEAIKEFADSFDDELAKLRDTYFEADRIEYGLVCEVIHNYLYRTLREMVGDKNE